MEIDRHLKRLVFSVDKSLFKGAASLVVATLVAFPPEYAGLAPAGRWSLFILVLAAALWATEAVPAFAVGIIVLGLEILVLGEPGGVFAQDKDDWQMFVAPWSSPLLWLFLGGLIMAKAAERTGLDRWFAVRVLKATGRHPAQFLASVMLITFVFSMFVSNTATAAMMLSVTAPVLAALPRGHRFGTSLVLAVAFAANIGGMGTVIGTPPNAIAAAALHDSPQAVSFFRWMVLGIPPAAVLLTAIWGYLVWRARGAEVAICDLLAVIDGNGEASARPWQRVAVVVVFTVTISMWMTGPLHGVPTPVVAFLPIVALTFLGIVDADDMRQLQWDVLLLLAGGMALGVAVTETGLASWLVAQLPVDGVSPWALAATLAVITCFLSNFMSNTAAANVIVPIAITLAPGNEAALVVPLALAASAAMCLPISTPPNAIAFATGRVGAREFAIGGVLTGAGILLLAPLWCQVVLH
jgi:sodium-dependent dicarboxylate transporter 2/3/5